MKEYTIRALKTFFTYIVMLLDFNYSNGDYTFNTSSIELDALNILVVLVQVLCKLSIFFYQI